MKKLIIILLLFLIVGCKDKSKFTCEFNIENMDNYNLNAKYVISYKGNYVTNIKKEEIYKSENKNMIEYLYNSKNLEYMNLNDLYGGYTYNLDFKENIVTLSVDINLKDVDISKMLQNNYLDKNYVQINRLTVSGIKKLYESKGGVCHE